MKAFTLEVLKRCQFQMCESSDNTVTLLNRLGQLGMFQDEALLCHPPRLYFLTFSQSICEPTTTNSAKNFWLNLQQGGPQK